jgi:Raf kinase inhibitor-like YbhB/YbcL family protein
MDNLRVSIDFLEFPPAHTCDGQNISPKITIQGLEASSVAIMVFNPSVRDVLSYCAWLIWDLPAKPVIPAGIPHGKIVTEPVSAKQGTNDAGEIGWSGPCPQPGQMARYLFRVYGLDEFPGISGGSRKHELLGAMHGHILQYGETEGVASRTVSGNSGKMP